MKLVKKTLVLQKEFKRLCTLLYVVRSNRIAGNRQHLTPAALSAVVVVKVTTVVVDNNNCG